MYLNLLSSFLPNASECPRIDSGWGFSQAALEKRATLPKVETQ